MESALRGVVLGIQTVEQAWHETLHAVSLKAILQRKKRHYSLLAENKVVSYQQIYFGEEDDQVREHEGRRNALKRAGIADFRWHDLRHTWASWLFQNGRPLYDLQEMVG